MLVPRSSVQCTMRFTTLNILLNRTLTTSLLIHSDGRTTLVILERYSWDFVIIIYGSIHINVFFALRWDVCLALWYPKMAFGTILWRFLPSLIYQPQPPSLNSKVCRGRKTFSAVACAISLRKHTVTCVSSRRTLYYSRMTRPNMPLIVLSMLWLTHLWYTPLIIQKDFLLYIASYATTIAMVLA